MNEDRLESVKICIKAAIFLCSHLDNSIVLNGIVANLEEALKFLDEEQQDS